MKKLIGTFAAFAFAVTASAQTSTADLEAQIQALLAQIAALSGTSTTTVAAPASCNFTQTLTLGSTGAEVVELQSFLEMKGTLTIPAGVSKGYFGGLTQSALASYQAMVGISPAVGYFGAVSRAHVNGLCSTVVATPTTGGTTGGFDTNSGEEASIEDFDFNDGDDDEVAEGEKAEVAEIEFDVEDADVNLERLDLTFLFAGTTGEDDPWDAFDTITLLVDGDEIASEDVSDEDDWLEEDSPFEFRFKNLDAVFSEGDTATVIVEVEAASSLDNSGTSGANDWTVSVGANGLRALDEAGIDQYEGDAAQTVTFSIEEEGADDELTVTESDDNPDAQTLRLEDDEVSDWVSILVFEIESEEGDVELNEVPVSFTSDLAIADVVNDFKIVIDGEEYDDYDNDGAYTGTTEVITFEFDNGEAVVDGGDTVEVEILVEFKSTAGTLANGTTIMAELTSANVDAIDAEGSDDLGTSQLAGSAVGETHDLYDAGLVVELVSVDAVASSSDEARVSYDMTVDVTGFEGDFFIEKTAAVSTDAAGDDHGFAIGVETPSDVAYTGYGSITSTVSVEDDKAGDTSTYIKVSDEQTRRITFNVIVDNDTDGIGATSSTGTPGTYQVQLNQIGYAATAVAATDAVATAILSDFETDSAYVEEEDVV